ncbi:MAG: methyl-accepting chemotaxis protein [Candidatus Marinimicrobia bacterium]|nr:methyl-accepting chemotaxis protein [Candidatus Neomarinimicrobiota bacterium]
MKRSTTNIIWILSLGIIVPIASSFLVSMLIPNWKVMQLALHSFIETLGLFAGISLALLLLLRQDRQSENGYYIWIASALIGMGILDGFHAAVPPGNGFVWLHSLAILVGGLLFSLIFLPNRINRSSIAGIVPGLAAFTGILIGVLAISFPTTLPTMLYEDGSFTRAAEILNIFGGLFFVIAATILIVRYNRQPKTEDLLFAFFCLLTGATGLLFPFSRAWTADWWLWHILRVIAYIVILGYGFYVFKKSEMEARKSVEVQAEIIERKKTEEELRSSESRYRTLVENIPQKVFLKDRNGHWISCNENMAHDLKLRPNEVVGKSDSDLFPKELAEKYMTDDKRIMESGKAEEIQEKYVQNGEERYVQTIKTPVRDENGGVNGVLGVFWDITERKLIEVKAAQRTADLIRVLKEVKEAINVLTPSASEVLAAATQVASGASETTAAVSETTATVEEVKQTAQVSNQKAKYISENAQKTAQVALSGKKAVEENIESVNRIREQVESIAESIVKLSEQGQAIGEIIATVTAIAEQVNLLSVNAAIEAARAGEQGKGFSVVAQEIKNLAEQSKQATAQVRAILNDVQKGISAAVMVTEQGSKAAEAGVTQAVEAGESISALAENVSEAAQAVTQIAASSQQQLVGMDQVVLAMENIKQASTESIASTKQVETSAQNLLRLSQKLMEMVEQFKLLAE